MKWFHIWFTPQDLFMKNDHNFITNFVKLLHQQHNPEDLALYSLKFKLEDGLAYYICSPVDNVSNVKSLLAHYNSQEVTSPNLKVLQLELGRNYQPDSQG